MNYLYNLPDDLIQKIYYLNHQSYQKEINKLFIKPQIIVYMDFHYIFSTDYDFYYRGNYIKQLVYHLENTF